MGLDEMKTYNQPPVNSIDEINWLKGQPTQPIQLHSLHQKQINPLMFLGGQLSCSLGGLRAQRAAHGN